MATVLNYFMRIAIPCGCSRQKKPEILLTDLAANDVVECPYCGASIDNSTRRAQFHDRAKGLNDIAVIRVSP